MVELIHNKFVSKTYYEEIDIIRGITVTFVVLGHSFPDFENGMSRFWALFITRFFYSFHMGLFFMISGFLFAPKINSRGLDIKKEIIGKIERLIIPYLLYSIITMIIKMKLNEYANHKFKFTDFGKIFLGISPNGGLWFLWTLFMINVIVLICNKIINNIIIMILYGIIIYIINLYFDFTFMSNVFRFIIFYLIGIYIYNNYNLIKQRFNEKCILVISLFVVIIFAYVQTQGIIGEEYYLISGIFGSYMIWGSVSILIKKWEGKQYLIKLSKYSYDIYLLSYFPQMFFRTICDRILGLDYLIVVIIMFISGMGLPILISKYILRKNTITSYLLLGIKVKR